MTETIAVTIESWHRFNGRKDVEHPSWFRVEYRMLEDPDFYGFSHEEFKVWLYLLAQACRKNSGEIRVNFEHAKAVSRLSKDAVLSAIGKLQELQLVHADVTPTLRQRDADVTRTLRDRQTDRQTISFVSQIEEIYKTGYPKKIGKSPGIAILSKQIQSEEQLADFRRAVTKYRSSKVVLNGFPMGFDRFARQWKDWLDPDAGQASTGPSINVTPIRLDEVGS